MIFSEQLKKMNPEEGKCPKCSYKTNYPKSIYNHFVTVHGYTCSLCDFTVKFKRDLALHTDMVHNKQCLTCTSCSFTATDMTTLLNHFKCNHNSITFQCSECDFKTRWRANLYKHKKKKCHT
jgi:KRAB domain-containing zinc finger protein